MLQLALLLPLAQAVPVAPEQAAQPAVPLIDPGFEENELVGWFFPDLGEGFAASVSGDDPFEGRNCALLEYGGVGRPQGFGNLIQSFAAKELRGKRVRLRAAVRTEGAGHAQLWLRTDGADGFSVLLDNMYDRPIGGETAQDWAAYDIVGDVDARTDTLVLGLMLFEGGKAFLDDVSVSVLGETRSLREPARVLEARGLRNLLAFARLFGYVRHFHPSDQARALDWDDVALAGVRALEGAPDDAELARSLQAFFAPVAPTVQVFASAAPPPAHEALARPADERAKLVRWRNSGFGQEEGRNGIYWRSRDSQRLRDGQPREGWTLPESAYEAELVPGIACRVPTVLWSDMTGTLPHAEVPTGWCLPSESFLASGDDRSSRLAAVILGWNVFQHFYPYFDVTEVDWPRELERTLAAAATDAGAAEFLHTLRRMVAALHDGHGSVVHACVANHAVPEVCWDWIEGELVVLAPSADGTLAPGDVVLAIDGVATREAFERCAVELSAATPQFLRHKALFALGRGEVGTKVTLEVRTRTGEARKVAVPRGAGVPDEPRPAKLAELEPGLWYVDLGRIQQADFEAALPGLARAKGIVFDLRGYPTIWTDPLAHLIDAPIECARWLVPEALLPDRKATTFQKSSWTVEPKAPRFAAKVVFLTDGRAVSAAETTMGLVEHHRLAPIVGEPTAGTNGNVNPFVLPGGYRVSWTGMKVLKQDGARHHGVGIQPSVPCVRTIAGVAAGRDEQLEKALELVR